MRQNRMLQASAARTDGQPPRAVSSVNLRYEDKAVFDLLHAWWALRSARPLRQWDAVSMLLDAALSNPDADVPEELRRVRFR